MEKQHLCMFPFLKYEPVYDLHVSFCIIPIIRNGLWCVVASRGWFMIESVW
uniref:Uncharacterized protein n=1 Tax=Anguilla anguilla TaxID=7936 RepID=A0A0E9QQF6_ANGAN